MLSEEQYGPYQLVVQNVLNDFEIVQRVDEGEEHQLNPVWDDMVHLFWLRRSFPANVFHRILQDVGQAELSLLTSPGVERSKRVWLGSSETCVGFTLDEFYNPYDLNLRATWSPTGEVLVPVPRTERVVWAFA